MPPSPAGGRAQGSAFSSHGMSGWNCAVVSEAQHRPTYRQRSNIQFIPLCVPSAAAMVPALARCLSVW
eukprot:29825-Eustigmatos_ZCMA.PRE.1